MVSPLVYPSKKSSLKNALVIVNSQKKTTCRNNLIEAGPFQSGNCKTGKRALEQKIIKNLRSVKVFGVCLCLGLIFPFSR